MRTFKLKKQKDVNKFNVSWFWSDRTGISEDRVKRGPDYILCGDQAGTFTL